MLRKVMRSKKDPNSFMIPWYLENGEHFICGSKYCFDHIFVEDIIEGSELFRQMSKHPNGIIIDEINVDGDEGYIASIEPISITKAFCKVVKLVPEGCIISTEDCERGYILKELINKLPDKIRISNSYIYNPYEEEKLLRWRKFFVNIVFNRDKGDEDDLE